MNIREQLSAVGIALLAIGLLGTGAYWFIAALLDKLNSADSDVSKMVVAGGVRLAGVGLLLGVGGVLLSGRFIRSFLFEVEPTDPTTIVLTGLVLLGTALLACFVPALRATRVDPVLALRSDA